MSKDIWHEPTETPTEHKTLLFDSIEFDETEMGVYSGGLFHSYNEFEPMTPDGLSRWAYLSDFINCQKEFADTKKKLDIAVDALKSAHEYYQNCIIREKQPHEINWYCTAMNMDNDIFKALEQITALEQKD